jgi:hypothetical protein
MNKLIARVVSRTISRREAGIPETSRDSQEEFCIKRTHFSIDVSKTSAE